MHKEDDVTWAFVWSPEDGTIDVDSEGRYQDKLSEWINAYGISDFYYNGNGNNNYTVTDGTNSEDLQLNETQTDVVPMPADYSPGPQTMYYRELQVPGVTAYPLCNSEGKLIRFDWGGGVYGVFDVYQFTDPLQLVDDNPNNWEVWSQACGGMVDAQVIQSTDYNGVCVLDYDGGKVSLDIGYNIVSGVVTQWNG